MKCQNEPTIGSGEEPIIDVVEEGAAEPHHHQGVVDQQTDVVVLLPRFPQEHEAVRDDHADEDDPRQHCPDDRPLQEVHAEQAGHAVQEQSAPQIVESFGRFLRALYHPQDLEEVVRLASCTSTMNMQRRGTATITFSEFSVPTCPMSYTRGMSPAIFYTELYGRSANRAFINKEPAPVAIVLTVFAWYLDRKRRKQVERKGCLQVGKGWVNADCGSSTQRADIITRIKMNLLNTMRPLSRIFPTIPKPPVPLNYEQRTIFTAIALFIYLICSQIPIYGIERSHEADPLYWARVIMASSRGTLMEFGISPIISAGWIGQILMAIGLFKVTSQKDIKDAEGLESVLAIIFCFGEAAGAIWYGAYGQPSQMSYTVIFLIIAQLMGAGVVVILLDDMLKKGYGLGSGISLFIVANTSETIFWFAFSPVTMSSEFGVEFEGAFIALVHFLFTKNSVWEAFYQAFTRQNGFNLSQLAGSFGIFCVLIFLQRYTAKVTLIHQKFPGYKQQIPVKLFYTSNMSVILQSMLISNFYKISQILHDRYYKSALIKLLGSWEGNRITGGILWYIAPPYSLSEAIIYPHRTIFYTAFVCFLCAVFAKFWIVISKSTPRDYAKMIRTQELTLPNFKEKSVIRELDEMIPTAAMLGGVIIGFLTVVGDLLNVAGSSTGIMLSISILYGYYEKMKPKEPVITQF